MERPQGLYQLLVSQDQAAYIVDDWVERGYTFDLRLRRAKTKGRVVIELTDTYYAAMLQEHYKVERVNIVRMPKIMSNSINN